ncbi:TPA: Rne/Rng family ribonuclease [Neisseria meningitidis]|uniref:Rne/Rng family ribonuclease n=1 Tax=Neisseria meningitidis TaxID=487 RepID=UPI0002A51C80|nr:Rne/Rng family ribonuclease [Neisseria meningitidis]ELK74672.1 ribonuclease, Rne/Rng family domain protein [Neisseria meningitidis 63041]ELL12252.1 ribonuclease, Rne/Rng family domain protein [Neisseria meningitidis 65014]ELL33156.1 ribonuclease, Rne/Rng family domain protein [Neisseria meningitidis 63006]EOB70017.1 ribonuclease, Rne/Rng family domain protein [Neisseria meningitidis 65012]EOB70152.1 ribonuclease, Rne/Rng family domain protein [Neisseria meningitidis 64182]
MKRMLFNATQAEELRVAIVDGQNLLDLDIETLGKEQRKGNIYKGIITRIEPSLEACFVDYGTDRHGFLPFKEVSRSYFQDYEGGRARIQDVLKEGMEVIVQVEKDERGNKGAALTTFISLAGRYLVLMPNNPRGGGVSRRIEGEERQELKAAMAQLDIPNGMSIIARTAGIGRSAEELEWDLNYLKQLWQAIEEAGKAHHDPYLLFMESSLLIRAIRDYFRPDIGEILVDNQEVYDQVAEFMSYVMPGNIGRLKLYEDHTPLFSRFQIEHQIESAFSRSVSLPSGGAIVIDHTEALVSIDVNSARATRGADIEDTAFKTNMEAAEEVARQMRLRDLGGLVVIDFIDMENPKHQRDVENVLRDALKKDRARVQMGKLSRFGLLELSRQRLKPALGESSHVACPRCAGTGVIRGIESTALHVLRIIQEEAMKDNTGEVHAQVPVDVATFLLNEKRAELFAMEERLDVNVVLIPNIHLENPHYEINRIRTDDVEEDGEPSYKRVAEPEEDESAKPFGGEKAKAARPEPAVKGVRHTSPAPTAAPEKKTSWWDSFKAWLKRIFGGSETQAAPAAETSEKRSTANRSGSRANNRRQNPRHSKREGSKVEVREVAGKTAGQEARADKAETRNNGNRRRNERGDRAAERANEAEIQDRNVQPAAPVADAAPSETEVQTGKRRRNGSRSERSQTAPETAAVAETTVQTAENTPSEPHTAEDKGSKPKSERNRRERDSRDAKERRERNNQRDRRQNGKKRNIPSAAKIEQYLNIHDTADKVRSAAAHVFGETDANAPITVSIADPVAERDLPTASPAVSNGDAPVYDAAEKIRRATAAILPEGATPKAEAQEMPSETATFTAAAEQARETAQTGGLVLIETDPAALKAWAAQPEVQTGRGLRRSEQPKPSEVATVPAEEMIQVETRQG